MVCEEAPEAIELSKAEQAIVDILTQYYLEELKFSFVDDTPLLLNKKSAPLVSSINPVSKKVNIGKGCYQVFMPKSVQKKQNYGTIMYLKIALNLNSRGDKLVSSSGMLRGGAALWQKLKHLSLAKIVSPSHSDDYYEFVDLSVFNLDELDSFAKTRAQKIIDNGRREQGIAGIREILSTPKVDHVLKT